MVFSITVSYEYDKLNRLICEETIDSNSNVVVKYVYTLGASGERIKVEEPDRTVEYTYDELYRLTSETITEGNDVTVYAYEYDNVSNRTLKTVNGVETVYTYNGLNQLTGENGTTYEYDGAGNLVRVIGTGKTALYEYNAENKLVKATVQQGNNVVVETYTYDYAGNRTSKTTSTNNHVEKVYYLNDNSSLTNVLVEIGADGTEKCFYTIGDDLVSQEIDGEVYTYIYDGHGTVRALANSKGKITDTYTYDAFGNLLSSTGETANNYLYCGEQFDSTTGLYYLRARYMDTSTGRFISMDTYQGSTADPISLHKYLYANSNPVMYTDPSGYCSLAETQVVMAGMAAIGGIITLNALGIFHKLTDGLIGLVISINEFIEETVESISDFASGAITSAEANINAMYEALMQNIMVTPIPDSWVESIPIPEADIWFESIPIPEADVWIETIPIPETDIWVESIPIPNADIWIETIPIPQEKGMTITYSNYKKPVSGKSGKEAAKDVPSWAKGNRPYVYENGRDFAKRLMDQKYGVGNYPTGPGSEYNKIKKWGDRGFE